MPTPLETSATEETGWTEAQTPMSGVSGNLDESEDVDETALVPTETPTTPEPTAIPYPTPEPPPPPEQPRQPTLGTDITDDGWAQFREGYHDAGGNPEWEEILVCVVSKEGGQWIGYHGKNGYWSRAQFSDGDTWPKVQRFLISIGVTPNPDSPYIVGLGVAWWANQISHPSHRSGWEGTWKLCTN